MKNQIINDIIENKLIVIVRGVKADNLIPLAEAMYEGGIRLIEITYSADGVVSDEDTAKSIASLVNHFGNRMHIGAGTVLTPKQVDLTAEAGGKFIISPDTNEEVIRRTVERGLVSMPGALTPTEIQAAHRFGADFVKLFPVTSLGPDYVKAVKAPLSHIKLLAVGGIDTENLSTYLKAGISGAGIGSNIVNKKLIDTGDFKAITELAKKYVQCVKE